MLNKMWPMAKRSYFKAKIDAEAQQAARRLGASHVLIIANFTDEDGSYNMIDGGTCVWPVPEVYRRMLEVYEVYRANDGVDTEHTWR